MNNSQRGIDYDLSACLEYNPQPSFTVDDIERVLAVFEGTNDETDWRWIILLKDNRFAALQGGCDYTGWDCQSWADSTIYTTVAEALSHFKDQKDIWNSFIIQLLSNKTLTWHERTGKELGLL